MVFLPATARSNDSGSAQSPVVTGPEPEFLIEASETYPALEKQTLDARTSLWFAFRIFDPDTPLYHPESRALGLSCWADLIAYKVERGVQFRLLLTDFDPVVGDVLHADTWQAVAALYNRIPGGDMQICPALHEARTGRYVRMALAPAIYARLRSKRNDLNGLPAAERADAYEYLPGYHRYMRLADSGQIEWRRKPTLPQIYPVTHHHKLAVFDAQTVILGGLDVNERRYDNPAHDRDSVDTWHDISLCVGGPVAIHAAQHIAGIWNMDYKAANRRMIHSRRHCPRLFGAFRTPLERLAPPASSGDAQAGDAQAGAVRMQIVQTTSRNRRQMGFMMRPKTVNHGLEDAHIALIREARTLLYIETQFFRHKPLAEAMAARARECPDLRLIMLLPAAPEEIAFDDDNGLDLRYGERLQADCIEIVREALGDRALFVCPAKQEYRPEEGRHVVDDAPIIYVHAKVAVADDAWGIVGSANLNGRSMKWDSELGLLWQGPSAGTLRQRLAHDWIDKAAADTPLAETYDLWRETAWGNAAKPVGERRGFILPYRPEEAEAIGVNLPLLPPEIV